MIRVIGAWIETKFDVGGTWRRSNEYVCQEDWAEEMFFRLHVGVFRLDNGRTKYPTWRLEKFVEKPVWSNREGMGKLSLDLRWEKWINGSLKYEGLSVVGWIYPNKPIDKGDIVALYPECKKMPQPIAMDYIRDRA